MFSARCPKWNIRRATVITVPNDQREKDEQIPPDMMAEMLVSECACASLIIYFNQSKYRTGNRKIQTRSTKCQNRPEISMRLVNRSGSVFHILNPGPKGIRSPARRQ